jgi:hypothetical protein
MLYSLFHLTQDSAAADFRRPEEHDVRVDRRPPKKHPNRRRWERDDA